jgi:hypothetical protein
VFHALSPKVGLLGALAADVVITYAATKSLFEDIGRLREAAKPVLEGIRPVQPAHDMAFLLDRRRSALT